MAPVKKPEHSRAPTFIRQWRKHRSMTQEQIAERIEIDPTTFGRIEKGVLPYNQDFLERLAFALSCEPSELLTIDPLKPDPPKLVYDRLRAAGPAMQRRALDVLEALLKAG